MMIIDEEGIIEVIRLIGGEEATQIAQKLVKKPGLTDDKLAEMLGLDIKYVRKILHQLNDLSLVTYELTFDKRTNRRVFKWRLQPEQVLGVARTQIKKIVERLKQLKEYINNNQFYWCGNDKCRKYTFEEALDKLFTCPTCGAKLDYHDSTGLQQAIDKKLAELEKLLS